LLVDEMSIESQEKRRVVVVRFVESGDYRQDCDGT
jgi:hypothetical protein